MKLECIEDVIMNVDHKRAFTKGNIYNGYYYSGKHSIDPLNSTLCAKNDFGKRHHIKGTVGTEEFFDRHFREVPKT